MPDLIALLEELHPASELSRDSEVHSDETLSTPRVAPILGVCFPNGERDGPGIAPPPREGPRECECSYRGGTIRLVYLSARAAQSALSQAKVL